MNLLFFLKFYLIIIFFMLKVELLNFVKKIPFNSVVFALYKGVTALFYFNGIYRQSSING